MYDAKLNSDENNDEMRYNCIEERGYFSKVKSESILNQKSSHVPIEDIVNMH
jgi:hypothetical protein